MYRAIRKVRNGYTVEDDSLFTRGQQPEPWVFETLDALINHLRQVFEGTELDG